MEKTKYDVFISYSWKDIDIAKKIYNAIIDAGLKCCFDKETFLSVFEGVPTFQIAKSEIEAGIPVLDFLAEKTAIFPSKGEARKTIQGGGVSINKTKVSAIDMIVNSNEVLNGAYILVQKGKKNYFLITVK